MERTGVLSRGLILGITGALLLVGCVVFLVLVVIGRNMTGRALVGELIQACVDRDQDRVEALLSQGADPNKFDSHGRATALGVAADSGDAALVDLLLRHGADPNRGCPLYYAASQGHDGIVGRLLDVGADPNRARLGGVPSPLVIAAENGHVRSVNLLLGAGASLGPGDGANVPLILAAGNGHNDVVTILLKAGVDVNSRSSDGDTALHRAMRRGHPDTVEILLEWGADPEHKRGHDQWR